MNGTEYHEPTNTVLVMATPAEFKKIDEQIIQQVSKTPTIGTLQIYRIPLKYAVADEVAKTLQDFFDKKSGISRGGRPARHRQRAVAGLRIRLHQVRHGAQTINGEADGHAEDARWGRRHDKARSHGQAGRSDPDRSGLAGREKHAVLAKKRGSVVTSLGLRRSPARLRIEAPAFPSGAR